MATDIGKVGIVMKGTWSSSATYEVLDAVSYNGGFYITKQAVPANTEPTNTTYWQAALVRNLTNINQTRVDFTSASTLTYTGASITIPANSNYSISVNLVYAGGGGPKEIAISASNSSVSEYNLHFKGEQGSCSISGRTGPTALTLYIWARYVSEASNYLFYSGWYES